MKLKKKGVFTREEMAQYLSRLAGMVADGEILIENSREPVGDEVVFTLELKKKKGVIEIELTIKARSKQEVNLTIVPRGKERFSKKERRPYKAKQIKKTMGTVWKDFRRLALGGSSLYDSSVINKLIDLMDAYDNYTEDAWREEWSLCKKEVIQAIEALKAGDLEKVAMLIEAVDDAIKRCHRLYK